MPLRMVSSEVYSWCLRVLVGDTKEVLIAEENLQIMHFTWDAICTDSFILGGVEKIIYKRNQSISSGTSSLLT